jgi:hypothetical protein
MSVVRCAALIAAIAASWCFCVLPAAARDGRTTSEFDRPLQTRRVVLGPSPYTPGKNREVRCFTFAHVMVKEIDDAEVGDEQISLLPITSPNDHPPCRPRNLANERVLPSDEWNGYFLGVRREYVFLTAADGVNSGMGFSVYRGVDTASIFQDSVKYVRNRVLSYSIAVDGNGLRLRYTRAYTAACSVQTEGAACWDRIVAETHLPSAPPPDRAANYLRAKRQFATWRCENAHRKDTACIGQEMDRSQSDDDAPSVIGYDVDVLIAPQQTTMTPAGSGVTCWPAS